MKAIVTSIGEPTTELCVWSLQRNGFDIHLLKNKNSLASKLADIYNSVNEPFLRVDADVIVNRNMTPGLLESLDKPEIWWWQFTTFDWFKQDINYTMAYIKKEALPALRANIGRFQNDLRPETQISRIKEFYEPRRFTTYDKQIMGLHGYGIRDMKPVIKLKTMREQLDNYDFDLALRLNEL